MLFMKNAESLVRSKNELICQNILFLLKKAGISDGTANELMERIREGRCDDLSKIRGRLEVSREHYTQDSYAYAKLGEMILELENAMKN